MSPLAVGSLFSGIGGLDLGLERAGMEVRWQAEIDPWCRRVLARHWPGVPCYDDVRLIDERADRVDVLCGGFPCQPNSHAGKRLGTADPRWLWPEFARIIRVLRPRYVVVENVPGLATVNGGAAFGEVLGSLAEEGFDAEWECFGAADIGAPHKRARLWIVAAHPDADRGRCEGERLAESAGLAGSCRAAGRAGELADAEGKPERAGLCEGSEAGERWRRSRHERGSAGWYWSVEPDVGRVAYGIPARVDRLRALGNAVVPQAAELIGRYIIEREEMVS